MKYDPEALSWLFELAPELRHSPAYRRWRLAQIWEEIVGEYIAEQSYVGKWDQGVLTIFSENSVLMHQLFIQKKRFIEKWNTAYPKIPVHDIIFRQGRPQISPAASEPLLKRVQEEPLTALSETTREAIVQAFSGMEPASLREALIKVRQHHAMLEQNRRAAGWKECTICGTLTDMPEKICESCVQRMEAQRKSQLLRHLLIHGNDNYEQVYRAIPCTELEYEVAREDLLRQLRDRIFWRQDTPADQECYVRLKWRLPEEAYTAAKIEREIQKLPRCKEINENE